MKKSLSAVVMLLLAACCGLQAQTLTNLAHSAPDGAQIQFLLTDGESFCHEEKRDLEHRIEYPEKDCVFYRLTNSERNGRYRLIKHVLADPHSARR